MAILNEIQQRYKLFMKDYVPYNFYRGFRKIAGYLTKQVSGTNISISDNLTPTGKIFEINGASSQATALLPSTYTQIDYLQSSGTQFINTGFIPNQDTSVETKTDVPNPNNTYLYGSRINYNVNAFGLTSTSAVQYVSHYNNTIGNIAINSTLNVIKKDKNLTYLNGTLVNTQAYGTFTCPGPMYLFALNNNGTPSFQTSFKLYYCKIWDNGVLVRYMIPCKRNSDNVLGMYDIVNNVFYINSGTGTFTAGANTILPNLDVPIEIQTVKDINKFNIQNWLNNTVTISNGTISVNNQEFTLTATNNDCFTNTYSMSADTSYNQTQIQKYGMIVKPNTKYVFSVDRIGNSISNGNILVFFYDKNYNYKRSMLRTSYADGKFSFSFTTSDETFITFRLGVSVSGITITYKNIQIEEGLYTSDYVPFNSFGIKVQNKNLWISTSNSVTTNGITVTDNHDGTFTINGTSTGAVNATLVPQNYGYYANVGEKYSLSMIKLSGSNTGIVRANTQILQADGTSVYSLYSDIAASGAITNSPYTITQLSHIQWMRIVIGSSGVTCNNLVVKIQLEKGDITPWELPQQTVYPITIGTKELPAINTYKTQIIEKLDGYYFRDNVGKIVLDGTQEFTKSTSYSDSSYFCGYLTASFTSNMLVNSSGYIDKMSIGLYSNILNREVMAITTQCHIRILASKLTENSVAGLQTYLSENPITMYYQLATPVDTKINDATLIDQLNIIKNLLFYNGKTNITSVGGLIQPTLNVEYYIEDTTV